MPNGTFSFENLRAYKVARELVKSIYLIQNKFPKEERYALGDQVRRVAVFYCKSCRRQWKTISKGKDSFY